jgi:N-methylhydantoinase A
MQRRSRFRPLFLAIDTGGTFTDCVWVEGGQIRMVKLFSTPHDPSQAIADVLKKVGARSPLTLLHGTTVGTNTLLQRKGARVALITTAGFEDVIEIGRQNRPKLYDLFFDRVAPLVTGKYRFGIDERTACDGEIIQEPSQSDLRRLAEKVSRANPESVAVSLLFSFANPENEKKVISALGKLGVPISVSHRILPEFREYERTSTVVVNAYLQPVMETYLENLEKRLFAPASGNSASQTQADRPRSAKPRIFIMQSSGGIAALNAAASEPVRTVLSGPAGGVVGAAAMARRSGFTRIVSFDMGGTSTDVALVDGEAHASSQSEIAGFPVGVPMLDIHTVGAGGGSIARFDAAGAVRVGPESAGADPGPICYGRGTEPTVTDANLILGRLQAKYFLGGEFVLDEERTRKLITKWLNDRGSPLSVEQFAAGVIRVVNATMEKAIRVVSVERGHDPREFTLLAFGGAGGLHACELADALGIPRVIVPALPGALSAFGILVSDVVKDYSRTVLRKTREKVPFDDLDEEFARLRRTAERDLKGEGWLEKTRHSLSVDVRFRGQGYEINVPYTRRLVKTFQRQHRQRYGYSYADREIEVVTLRLRSSVKSSQSRFAGTRAGRIFAETQKRNASDSLQNRVSIILDGKRASAAMYDRELLPAGKKFSGPAIVAEFSGTTLVPRGKRFWIDKAENLMIDI